MGLIKGLLLLPVAPVRGVLWVSERIADQVEQQHYSGAAGVQQIDEIEEAKRTGALSEEEAAERQEAVLERQLVHAGNGGNGNGMTHG